MAERTNNDLQNIAHKTKDWVTWTPLKTGGELKMMISMVVLLSLTARDADIQGTKNQKFEDTTLCDKVCQWLATGQWFSLGATVSSTNETDRSDITIVESGIKHHNPNAINTKVVIRNRISKKSRKTMA